MLKLIPRPTVLFGLALFGLAEVCGLSAARAQAYKTPSHYPTVVSPGQFGRDATRRPAASGRAGTRPSAPRAVPATSARPATPKPVAGRAASPKGAVPGSTGNSLRRPGGAYSASPGNSLSSISSQARLQAYASPVQSRRSGFRGGRGGGGGGRGGLGRGGLGGGGRGGLGGGGLRGFGGGLR